MFKESQFNVPLEESQKSFQIEEERKSLLSGFHKGSVQQSQTQRVEIENEEE